ncbi:MULTISPECIES: class I SAM-dependent methyltransferase [Terrabacteria group]|uniref:tRNA (adenine(22)-N(1))-methyltransferase n=1 Tax=Bacillati TaxID=1783272 RepID=UPI001C6E1823|nr:MULTISPECIES: class I SAM-dependent methyltransferase [Terrabacteria group]MBW9212390.1 class I SAM-dependent methyltransferase [Trueperella sp. zg.1013]
MISKRLKKIKHHVQKGLVMADIGCDHAFLSIDLMRDGIAKKVYACDIAKGPLAIAKDNIKYFGYEDVIQTILSDGLAKVPEDTQGIIIAGMGGQRAIHILASELAKAKGYKQILLQVNRGYEELRKWLFEHGFSIQEEWVVYDRKFYYLSIFVYYTGESEYQEEDVFIGPYLKKKKDLITKEWFENEIKKTEKILSLSHDEQLKKRIFYYKEYIKKFEDEF